MTALLKKEFLLCIHPTAYIFLAACLLIFVPNYPYEIIFFFSGLSVFFTCLTARENGDAVFSCTLPVKKERIAFARVGAVMILQCVLLCLTGACVAIKENVFPSEALINLASTTANLAFLGYGGILTGAFNLIFFPLYYKNVGKVGAPFLIAASAQFLIIILLILLRHASPVYAEVVCSVDPAYLGAKLGVFFCGAAVYFGSSGLSAYLAQRNFKKADL